MATRREQQNTIPRNSLEAKIIPNPAAFFEIIVEADDEKRSKKLQQIELCFEDDDGTQSICSTTLTQLDASWQTNIPALLQRLAGRIYIDKQRLTRLGSLGEGGFAVVEKMELLSENKTSKEAVAVKKLKPGVIEDDEDLKELVEESNLLRRVRHKGIVEFKGIGCFDETSVESMRSSVFLAEEFMSGGTLKSLILDQMRMGSHRLYWMEDAWRWLLEVAEALCYLHTCTPSVVHRDLKPENVLMSSKACESSQAKIADFGLHKRINKVTLMQRAKSSNLLEALTNDSAGSSSAVQGAQDGRPLVRTAEIEIPAPQRARPSKELPDLSPFALDIPSHFRIIKKSSSLCKYSSSVDSDRLLMRVLWSGVHRESALGMVPEESPVNDSFMSYGPLPSAFSVPQALLHQDVSPIHLVTAEPQADSTSLKDVLDQMNSAEDQEGETESNGTCASIETHPSDNGSEKKVRGGQLGQLMGLRHASEKTGPSKKSRASFRVCSPFEEAQRDDSENRIPWHFLFQPNRKHHSKKPAGESKQHGSRYALDQLKEVNPHLKRVNPTAKDMKKSSRFSSNKFALGLSGTNVVSGIVGSLMYMAPEVYKGKHYDEKVDVFGFGVILYELLLSELVIVRVLMQARKPSEMHHLLKKHAKSVAKGHREPIPEHWPQPVQQLIQDCWHQHPDTRPRMAEVIERLREIKQQGCIDEMDKRLAKFSEGSHSCCSCCLLT